MSELPSHIAPLTSPVPSHDFAAFVLPHGKSAASHCGSVEPGRLWQDGTHEQQLRLRASAGLDGWLGHWGCPEHPSGGGSSWLMSSQTVEGIRDLSATLN